MQQPKPGPNLVGEYQVSGLPFVLTGSSPTNRKIDFPYVTQWLLFKSTGGTFNVGFASGSIRNGNSFLVPSSGTVGPLALRVRTVFLNGTGNFEVIAGLTMIESRMFPVLTSSAMSSSTGSEDFGYIGLESY